jgi:hypothetical protein
MVVCCVRKESEMEHVDLALFRVPFIYWHTPRVQSTLLSASNGTAWPGSAPHRIAASHLLLFSRKPMRVTSSSTVELERLSLRTSGDTT